MTKKPATTDAETAARDAQFNADAARKLDAFRRRFEAGEAEALLEAVDWILTFKAEPPDWVRVHFTRKLGAFLDLDVSTLDLAFGIKPKEKRVVTREKAHIYLVEKVTGYLLALHRDRHALNNDDAFRMAADKFGVGIAQVKRCWREGRWVAGLSQRSRTPPTS